jgi:hypothetical protein
MAIEADAEIDGLAQRILSELEGATSKDLSDTTYAKMILHLTDVNYCIEQIECAKSEDKKEIGKRAIIKVLLLSTWLQRLYFIIRSFLMGQIGAIITSVFIIYFGTIDVVKGFIIGIFVFVFSLVITRIFDAQITAATRKIVVFLSGHRSVRDFIMNHF